MQYSVTSSKALFCLVVASAVCGPTPAAGSTVHREVVAMGTQLRMEVRAPARARGLEATEAVIATIEAAEARLSTWRKDTELARANRSEEVVLSSQLAGDLRRAWECAQRTEGAFDPSIGPLVETWGLRTGGRNPAEAEVEAARRLVNWRSLDLQGRRLRKALRVRIEEGGFGKGAGLDDVASQLKALGIEEATLNFGGQVLRLGDAIWVPLAHPQDRKAVVAEVRLSQGALATSGHSERPGHLLDPRSGKPARNFGSLTVIAASSLEADCLSTGLYVMGPEAALEFAARTPGVEVLVVERGDQGPTVRASRGVQWRHPSEKNP